MTSSKVKYILVAAFFALFSPGLSAQVKQSEHDPTFNALDYSLQKRYRPENDPFVTEKFMDNTFFSLYLGASQIAGSENIKYSWGGSYGLTFGKWLNYANGVRLSAHGESYIRTSDAQEILSHGLEASYMLNLTSYMGGYRTSRFCELSMVTGLGFNMSTMGESYKPAGEIHLGLNASMKFSRAADFFIEPMAYFHTGSLTQLGSANWKKYNLGYGVNMGLTVNVINKKARRERIPYLKHSFIALTGGAQFQNSAMVYDNVGLVNSLGNHYAVSFGRWVDRWFALRGTAFHSFDIWSRYLGEYDFTTDYYGLRIEAMFDFLNMSPKAKGGPHSLILLVGPEVGYMNKVDLFSSLLTPYVGVSAGLQYRLRVCKWFALFVEPRMSVIPYTHDGMDDGLMIQEKFNYIDNVVNVNFGMEFAF